MADLRKFTKFVQLVKVDEAKREVGGLVTAEVVDKMGEICHYASTKPYYEAWSEEFSKATDGKSVGNLREMHGLSAAGVGKSIEFRDDEKAIFMTFKVVDDDAWHKVQEGVYTGFSQGGSYITTWPDKEGRIWYTAEPSEVSLVDNPCLGAAHFDFIRADGRVEIKKFKRSEAMGTAAVTPSPQFITADEARKIASETLAKADADKVAAETKLDVIKQTKKFCETQAEAIIKACAEAKGFTVSNHPDGTTTGLCVQDGAKKVKKGMYEVAFLASLISDFAFLAINQTYEEIWEQDQSKLPEELLATLNQMASNFLAMAEEEVKEVVQSAAEAGKSEGGEILAMSTQTTDLQKAANKSLAAHLKKMADGVTAHQEKAVKMHKDHHDDMHDHITKMCKMLGSESEDAFTNSDTIGNEPEPKDVEAGAAPNIQHAGKGLSAEEIQKMITESVTKGVEAQLAKVKDEVREATMNEVVDNLTKAFTDETAAVVEAQPVTKATPGVGSREAVAKAGPVVRAMPVTKATDDNVGAAPENKEPADISKAFQGNREEMLKLMKGVKATQVPASLQSAVARLAR